jgi:hypothetical protein
MTQPDIIYISRHGEKPADPSVTAPRHLSGHPRARRVAGPVPLPLRPDPAAALSDILIVGYGAPYKGFELIRSVARRFARRDCRNTGISRCKRHSQVRSDPLYCDVRMIEGRSVGRNIAWVARQHLGRRVQGGCHHHQRVYRVRLLLTWQGRLAEHRTSSLVGIKTEGLGAGDTACVGGTCPPHG